MTDEEAANLRYEAGMYQSLYENAAARIDALEAALRTLLKEPPSILDDPDTDAQIVIRMRKIARTALDKDAP